MTRILTITALVALAFGLLYRMATLFIPSMPVPEFFITEDGYLMLTVARNMAIGNGMSVSDGEVVTNGIQPLATFLFTVPYLFTDGDKIDGIVGVILISIVVAVLGAVAVYLFTRRALASVDASPAWSLVAAGLWFSGPLLLFHSMNALETGLYTMMVVFTACYFAKLCESPAPYTLGQQIIFGSLCGIVFLSRIDGAFFVTGLFLARFIYVQASGQLRMVAAIKEALPPGILSLVFAAPWLIYNYNLFGSIMPISGHSQALGAGFANNAPLAPAKLFEHTFPMLPIPEAIETNPAVQIICGVAVVVVVLAFLWHVLKRQDSMRVVLAGYLIYGCAIVGYYSLHFGAPHFLSRYFAPLSPLLIVAALIFFLGIAKSLPNGRTVFQGIAAASLILCIGLLGRIALPGVHAQGHFQVVHWIEANVEDETWVGAVQTGTLGYWHDRTVNLDGKVNPDALSALFAEGNILPYVVRNEKIKYLADWELAHWAERSDGGFSDAFEVLVDDRDADLSVLRRRGFQD